MICSLINWFVLFETTFWLRQSECFMRILFPEDKDDELELLFEWDMYLNDEVGVVLFREVTSLWLHLFVLYKFTVAPGENPFLVWINFYIFIFFNK